MNEARKTSENVEKEEISWGELYAIALKIRGIGYLIENQKAEPSLPFDFDVVMDGLGQVIGELGTSLFETTSALETVLLNEIESLRKKSKEAH